MNKKIGIIGCGIMGSGIIRSLYNGNFQLNIYDRNINKALKFSSNAQVFKTPKGLAANSDIIIAVTTDDISSNEVWFGENGVILSLKENTICIEMSTLSINYLSKWIEKIEKKKCKALVSAMTGSRNGANTSNLDLFVGGDSVSIDIVKPILKKISNNVFYFNKQIDAMRFKLIYNYFGASILIIFSEILKIIQSECDEIEQYFEILSTTGWGKLVVKKEFKKIVNKEFEDIECSLLNICKDIRYAYNEYLKGKDNNLILLTKVAEIYNMLEKENISKYDMSVIYKTLYLEEK